MPTFWEGASPCRSVGGVPLGENFCGIPKVPERQWLVVNKRLSENRREHFHSNPPWELVETGCFENMNGLLLVELHDLLVE